MQEDVKADRIERLMSEQTELTKDSDLLLLRSFHFGLWAVQANATCWLKSPALARRCSEDCIASGMMPARKCHNFDVVFGKCRLLIE